MAEIQHHAFAHIKDVPFDEISLALTATFDDFFPMIKDRLVIEFFQEFKEGPVADTAIFDDFPHAIVDEALRQGL